MLFHAHCVLCIEYAADVLIFILRLTERSNRYPFHRKIGSSKQELRAIIENHIPCLDGACHKAVGRHECDGCDRMIRAYVRNSARLFMHFISNWIINRDLFLIEWHGMRQTNHTYVCPCKNPVSSFCIPRLHFKRLHKDKISCANIIRLQILKIICAQSSHYHF